FHGNKEVFCEKVGYKVGSVNHFLSPRSQRPCSDHAARTIERRLDMEPRSLDTPRTEKKQIYYVAISTNAQYTYETVRQLQGELVVMECAAVLGDFDLLIKVEVEHFKFLDVLLAKLVKLPGVKRSRTYKAIDSLHWQRAQQEQMEVPPKEHGLYVNNGIGDFIHRKLNHLFDEIKMLEQDTIIVKDHDLIGIQNHQLLEGTKKSICAIRVFSSHMSNFDEFLRAERELVKKYGVNSRRIIVLEREKSAWYRKEGYPEVKKLYEQYAETGCEVRFLYADNWIPSSREMGLEKFIILDDSFVCSRQDKHTIRKDEEEDGQVSIHSKPEIVKLYTDTFSANWNKAVSFAVLCSRMFEHDKR
ncbi:MAG: hypothetical protein BWK73_40560, partial [Thiothrix lacustris]